MSDTPKVYLHLTNLQSPIDQVDQMFLNILGDYRIAAPQPTLEKTTAAMQLDGVFGVYTTVEAISKPAVVKLTGFKVSALSKTPLA